MKEGEDLAARKKLIEEDDHNFSSIQKLSMECSKCRKLGFTSTIERSIKGWTTTAYRYPFNDKFGRIHHHSIKITVYTYWCSAGHCFDTKQHAICWCGWPTNKEFD